MPTAFEPRHWFVSNTHQDLQQLPLILLLTLLFRQIDNYRSAAASLKQLLGSEEAHELPLRYYRAVYNYLQARANDIPDSQMRESLTKPE